MKHIMPLSIICFVLILIIIGCRNNNDRNAIVNNSNSIENIINEQISNSTFSVDDNETQYTTSSDNLDMDKSLKTQEKVEVKSNSNVDYDLTTMNADMVYATIYQMMMCPKNYIGKTFRIEGLYYAAYYEPTGQYYHYCIIQDATACCTQGLEFVWDDGTHVYPNEYPKDNTEIIVEGTLETYKEKGDSNLYYRLKDSTLEIKSN